MLESVTGSQPIENAAFEELHRHARTPVPRLAQISEISHALFRIPEDIASRRFPAHLQFSRAVNNQAGTRSTIRHFDIALPPARLQQPERFSPSATAALRGLLNVEKLAPYQNQSSPWLSGGERASFAVRTDRPGPWGGAERVLMMHVDHRHGMARALTLLDATSGHTEVAMLLDGATPSQRRRSANEPGLGSMPPEVLLKVLDALPSESARALMATNKQWRDALGDIIRTREQLEALVPEFLQAVVWSDIDIEPQALQTLREIAGGAHCFMLVEALERSAGVLAELMLVHINFLKDEQGMDERLAQRYAKLPAVVVDFCKKVRESLSTQ